MNVCCLIRFLYQCLSDSNWLIGTVLCQWVLSLMGLAARNFTEEAWTEFERNSLHWQSSVFPEQWVGQW